MWALKTEGQERGEVTVWLFNVKLSCPPHLASLTHVSVNQAGRGKHVSLLMPL